MKSIPLLLLSIGMIISSTIIFDSWAIHEDEYILTNQNPVIPSWVKNNAGWWANGEITENEFLYGVTYLIDNKIIEIHGIPLIEKTDDGINPTTKRVPEWIKNNAGWWANGDIPDSAFISGLEWLISNEIMKVDFTRISFVPIEDVIFADIVKNNDATEFAHLATSLFETYADPDDYIIEDGKKKWYSPLIALNPNNMEKYNEIALWHDSQKAVVVFPVFTMSAYAPGGFYDYYRGECDDCTTAKFATARLLYTSSGNAVQVFSLLGYDLIDDSDIDQNPSILKKYDKVIILHNEYVTRTMFDAITSHPKVIYLYPNALYAEIDVNYADRTITLIRGHNYPPEDPVSNGFDWEFDNTHPYEYDNDCLELELYSFEDPRANVGVDVARNEANKHWQTTCYPELIFYGKPNTAYILLEIIKGL